MPRKSRALQKKSRNSKSPRRSPKRSARRSPKRSARRYRAETGTLLERQDGRVRAVDHDRKTVSWADALGPKDLNELIHPGDADDATNAEMTDMVQGLMTQIGLADKWKEYEMAMHATIAANATNASMLQNAAAIARIDKLLDDLIRKGNDQEGKLKLTLEGEMHDFVEGVKSSLEQELNNLL